MRARREVEQFEFRPPTTAAVLERMHLLSAAGDGWINLLPGVPEEAAEERRVGIFSAVFGAAPPPVTMCTWMPHRTRRGSGSDERIGILHPRGRLAASQLGELGAPVPFGWHVGQDHSRRGLIVHPASGAQPAAVLDWVLRAGTVLAAVPLTGSWKAQVYLPRNSGGARRR